MQGGFFIIFIFHQISKTLQMKKNVLFTFILLNIISFTGNGQIVINEILASNSKVNADGFGEHDDWVEFYNPTDDSIQLGGMFLTDNKDEITKHEIGTKSGYWTQIPPKSYILFWIDGDPEQGQRHASFKLNKKGGYLGLYDQNLKLIDEINYSKQTDNVSFGRNKDNSQQYAFFKKPTPNLPNVNGRILNKKASLVSCNISSGFYNETQNIILKSSDDAPIYYTLDGSEPSTKSFRYRESFNIDSSAVLRARIIKPGYMPDIILNKSIFINEKNTLNVVSLIVAPKDLWKKRRGIYTNFEKRGMEVPAYVEYFDTTNDGNFKLAFTKSATTRIAGKTSRRQPKKSFAFFASNDDGKGERFNYPVFKDKDISSFGGLWVRADATSGRNVSELWVGERFKNELLYEVNSQMQGNIDMQAYEPVSLYLNGKYWGLYNLMERKGRDFIFNNHGETDVDVLTSEDAKAVAGNISAYDQMIFYIAQNDITTDSVYQKVCDQIDINSYIDYWINETYCGAKDIWVNIRFWKSKEPGAKWRWISYDQDSWYTSQEKSLNYYTDNGKVFLLGRLIKNPRFREQWINRMCDYLNTGFKAENVIDLVDDITKRIEFEVPRDKDRWSDSMLYIRKGERINWIKNYAFERPEFLREHMIDYFQLNHGVSKITINQNSEMGFVRINSIIIKDEMWEGNYIEDNPIQIEAIAREGYVFERWKSRRLPENAKITVNTKKNKKVTPIFKKL